MPVGVHRGLHWIGLGVRDIVAVGIDLASLIEARLGCKIWPCGNLSYKQKSPIYYVQSAKIFLSQCS